MAFHFLKTGAASAAVAQQAAVEQQQQKESMGKLWRFFMKEKEEARITFVDGDLNAEGFLLPPRYYEHNLYLNGKWNNFFVCPEKTNPGANDKCPLCEIPDRPTLVALFTIIDHREFASTKDKTKKYKDTKKLMVVKPRTFEVLNKIANKRGGLAGCTFDASRIGDQSASVGSMFDFVEKKSVEELMPLYMVEKIDPKTNVKTSVSNFTPADYESEIIYRTGQELRVLVGSQPADPPENKPAGQPVDYTDKL